MTTTRYASHDTMGRMTADLHQLAEPFYSAVRRQVITHDPLLDELRAACLPGGSTLTETIRQRSRESQPPASTAAISVLAEIEVGIAFWRVKLDLPSPTRSIDWYKAVLSMLPTAAESLDPKVAEWLSTDVNGWWTDAARASGWRTTELLKLR